VSLPNQIGLIYDVYANDQNHIWAVEESGNISLSNDGGDSWTAHTIDPSLSSMQALAVRFVNNQVGWLVGGASGSGNAGIYRSLDGGLSWRRQKTGEFYGLELLKNPTKIIAVGSPGAISILEPPDVTSLSKTQFLQGTSETISIFGAGFESYTTIFGNVLNPSFQLSKSGVTLDSISVVSSTEIQARISVDPNAPVGSVDLTLVNIDTTQTTEVGAFTVGSGSSGMTITSVVPSSAYQGETVRLAINGTNIPNTLGSGSVEISLGSGITASFVTFESSSIITAIATVDSSATAGSRDLTVTVKGVSGEVAAAATKTSAFTVNQKQGGGTLPQSTDILPAINRSGVWNPETDGDLTVQVKVPVAGLYDVMIATASGIKYKKVENFTVGYNKFVLPANMELTNGTHVLMLQDPRTGKLVKAKVVVNR